MSIKHYTYRIAWSQEDGEYLGLCVQFPSLSWLAATPEEAFIGIRKVVMEEFADIRLKDGAKVAI